MFRGKTVRLFPTKEQEIIFRGCVGLARFAYNYVKALDDQRVEQNEIRLTGFDLAKELVKLKKQPGYEWMRDYPSDVHKQAALDFWKAKIRSKKQYGHQGNTKFKSRKDDVQGFACEYRKTKIGKKTVYISKIGDVKTGSQIPRGVALSNPRVIYKNGKWYISVSFEVPEETVSLTEESIGVDFGLTHLAITSTGQKFENPNNNPKMKRLDKERRRAQRVMNRRYQKGKKTQSKRYYRAKAKHAQICEKLANGRKDARHKISREIVNQKPKHIVLENLNIKSMMKNKKLSKAIGDAGWYMLRTYITYKAERQGTEIILADTYFASSKLCSACGEKHEGDFPLSIREWTCQHCHTHHDRDVNAAINLKQYPTL